MGEKKLRDSNIELCRVVSMLFIIGHHCAIHGGGYKNGGMFESMDCIFYTSGRENMF